MLPEADLTRGRRVVEAFAGDERITEIGVIAEPSRLDRLDIAVLDA
ncbi:hypothetical protein AB0D27_32070 [Streptomyces sp. NPDC048415]